MGCFFVQLIDNLRYVYTYSCKSTVTQTRKTITFESVSYIKHFMLVSNLIHWYIYNICLSKSFFRQVKKINKTTILEVCFFYKIYQCTSELTESSLQVHSIGRFYSIQGSIHKISVDCNNLVSYKVENTMDLQHFYLVATLLICCKHLVTALKW